MQQPSNPPTNQIRLQIGSNYTFVVECKSGTGNYLGTTGSVFSGWLFVNYTELTTGFPHTVAGEVSVKIS